MDRKLICNILDNAEIDVKFFGGHLTKRELLQLLKAIRLEYRRRIRVYRQNMGNNSISGQETETNSLGAKKDDNTVTNKD